MQRVVADEQGWVGRTPARQLATGAGRALPEVFPATREPRCWAQKVANVLDAEALLTLFDLPAEGRWRGVNGPHLVGLVRATARVERGRLVERPAEPGREVAGGPTRRPRHPR